MKKTLSILLLLAGLSGWSQKTVIHTGGDVNDFIVDNNTLVAATMSGTIETYNLLTHKLQSRISFPKIKDFAGDLIDAEVFKLAKINSAVFAIVHGEGGYNDIYKVSGKKKQKIIKGSALGAVAVSLGVSYDNKLVIGLLSNEIVKYNISTQKIEYRKQVNSYAFSAMVTGEEGKYLFVSDESGVISKVDIKSGKVVKVFRGQNVDNVLCVDYAAGVLVAGGKDRRFSVYKTNGAYHQTLSCFVLAVGISKSGKTAAWYDDNTNNIVLFNVNSRSKIKTLQGHKSVVNKIMFIADNQLISCGNDKQIIIWKI